LFSIVNTATGKTAIENSGQRRKIMKADLLASNGVIHVIDTALLPKD